MWTGKASTISNHRGFLSLCLALCMTSPKLDGVTASCRTGKAKECEKANYVPGYNLGGEGFDITSMERKTAYVIPMTSWGEVETCRLCRNPLQGNVYQKLPEAIADWRIAYKCKNQLSSTVHESSTSLTKSLTSSITNDWRTGLDWRQLGNALTRAAAGTHSTLAEFSQKKSAQDKYSFISQEMACSFYRYRIKQCANVTSEFDEMLNALPRTYNKDTKEDFRHLIDVFGTHYIRQVDLGGTVRDVTAIKSCDVAMRGMSKGEIKGCLDAEVGVTLNNRASIKSEASLKYCHNESKKKLGSAKFSQTFNERISEVTGGNVEKDTDILFPSQNTKQKINNIQLWMTSLKSNPDVVKYSLSPLHMLKCSPSHVKKNLRRAIAEYILEKQAVNKCPHCPKGGSPQPQGHCTCKCRSSNFLTNDCCPKKSGVGELTVRVLKGIHLHRPRFTTSNSYVQVSVMGRTKRTRTIYRNGNPVWNEVLLFGFLDLVSDLRLVITVYDYFGPFVRQTALCSLAIRHMSNAFVEARCRASSGYIIYEYQVQCAPMLSGPMCGHYNGSPSLDFFMGVMSPNITQGETN
ncbi:perforin-1-like [Ambystoma mexicanum]|uniref:perforin-1-like n=1 Tax=Ambystoma mexicanum TaxID=8296 RepID=UPI0037E8712A